jgi:outer membrane protein OmpA-like peptidoglycan-associated protein
VGVATNTATASCTGGATSNVAKATVQVTSDFLSSRSVLMGEVVNGSCGAPDAKDTKGLEGVRIFLEDGTFVDTDKKGMFHFEGITPGTHVVQLDLDSLPKDYQVVPCEENTRFAGSAYSQFVDVQGGSMWRTDFHVARRAKLKMPPPAPPAMGEMTLEMTSSLHGETVTYQLPMHGHDLPKSDLQVTVTLPDGMSYEANSSQLDDKSQGDPTITGQVLTFSLGSHPGKWDGNLQFVVLLPRTGGTGEIVSKAALTFAASGSLQKSLAAENTLKRVKKVSRTLIPEVVLHPHFPTLGTELSADDRQTLDDLGRLFMVLDIDRIVVTGHTDNVEISPRSQGIYRDNKALSLARADSVGRYLIDVLHLPPTKLEMHGMGDTEPIADNLTEEGRAQNRRVEVKVNTERQYDKIHQEISNEKSGVQKAEVSDPSYRPKPVVDDDEPDPAKSVAINSKASDGITVDEGFLSPKANDVLLNSISAVRFCIPVDLAPHLFLDGHEVPEARIGIAAKDNKSGKAIYSYIGVDFGEEGEHTLRVRGLDPFGIARFDQSVKVRRSGQLARIRLKAADGNIADGKTPVRMQLELLDASGHVIPAAVDLEIRSGTLKPYNNPGEIPEADKDKDKGMRLHVDAAGSALFQPVNTSGPYRVVVAWGKVTLELETYVKPFMRDWILVGLGEGTVGYKAVSGHIENLQPSDQDEHLYDDGRLAFYAKGKVKGEWLLTMAYDSSKGKDGSGNSSLFQTIDPNTYYTLYGDATNQQYEASSARKLFLKIERDQFYALFGDFDTGLTVTELSKYSRKMNGVKAEYQGKNVEANVFGSETAQAYSKDEIQGDGTSGLYHLSHTNIVLNSDTVTIEVRDRFRSEVIISTVVMSRFTDYNIDTTAGTIFFQQPVMNRDDNLNPIFIVVEYEVSGNSQAYTYGGRVGAKLLDQKLKAGFTYIHEGEINGSGNSYGLDASYKPTEETTLKAELARTDTKLGDTTTEGNACLGEVDHKTANTDFKLYYRELDNGFGLGQQNNSEVATRKFGFDVVDKLSKEFSISGDSYRQYNLATGGVEDVAEGKTDYSSGPYKASLGFRHADDDLGPNANSSSNQLTMGGSWITLNKKLTLRVEHDQSIGSNSDTNFPTSTTIGADYKLNESVALFGQQVITSSGGTSANTTSFGVKSTPWKGGAFNTSFGQNLDENGERMFALFGLKQTWKINPKWSVDGAVERNQTIVNSQNYQLNANVPPPSGDTDAFTSVSLGSTYTEKKWNWSNRLELRTSDTDNKWGIVSAYVGEPADGWGWSARCELFDTDTNTGTKTITGDLRFGMVYRPVNTRWILLDRLDFLYDKTTNAAVAATAADSTDTTTASTPATTGIASSDIDNRRVVNNLSANFKLDNKIQFSFMYGAKYVLEGIDGTDYTGFTDTLGIEGHYDLTKDWDIGLRGSVLHSWGVGQISYSAGPSVGYNVIKNAWVSVGYNVIGFADKDFSVANATAQGPYVRFRFKFDQNSIKDALASMNGK